MKSVFVWHLLDLTSSSEKVDSVLDLSITQKRESRPNSPGTPNTNRDELATETTSQLPTEKHLSSPMSLLAEAARVLEVQRSIHEAETLLDSLLNRFATPSDLCTSVQNLPSDAEIQSIGGGACRRRSSASSVSPAPSTLPAFSPVLKHLLCLPETQVLSDIHNMTPNAQCLNDLCSCLSGRIARTKRKVFNSSIGHQTELSSW